MRLFLTILLVLLNFNCAEAQVKVQDLTEDVTPARTDIGYTIKTPTSNPLPRKVQWSNILDLTGWSLSGSTITSTNDVTTTGIVTAGAFVGDGSGLSGITGGSGSSPAGSGSELQYRAGTQTLGALTGSGVSGGNLGIGSVNPTQKLDVSGTIKASTDILIGSTSVCLEDGTNCPSAGAESDPVVKALTGIIKSNGSAISAVTAPSGTIVGTTDSQSLTNKTIVGGSNTISGITEAMQSISDITTNNASTSNHGYLKKLSGTSTEYMDGSGAWSTPAGSGAAGGGWTDGGTSVLLTTTTDSVGIGTTTIQDSAKLNIGGGHVRVGIAGTNTNAQSSGELYVQGDIEVDGNAYIANLGSATTLNSTTICLSDGTNCPAAAGNGMTDGGSNVYLTTQTDTLGIGTTTASATIEAVKQGSSNILMVSSAATGDGDYLIVKSSGNVGIGTILPGTLLDVQGQGRFNSLSLSGSAGQSNFANANGIAFDSNSATMTTPDLTLTSGGNVGVGTSTAATKLVVSGTVTATAFLGDGSGLSGVGAGGWTDGGFNVYATTTTDNVGIGTLDPTGGRLVISSNGTSTEQYMVMETVGGNSGIIFAENGHTPAPGNYYATLQYEATSNQLRIKTGNTTPIDSLSNRLIIERDSGNVGIGTIGPLLGGLIVMNGNVGIGTINPANGKLHMPANGTATSKVVCFGTNNCIGYCTALTAATGVCSSCTCF